LALVKSFLEVGAEGPLGGDVAVAAQETALVTDVLLLATDGANSSHEFCVQDSGRLRK